jgi:para-aminobenzoate synthetase component 1
MTIAQPFDYRLAPEDVAPHLRAAGGLIFLDSAWRDAEAGVGRYSYLGVAPSLVLVERDGVTRVSDAFSGSSAARDYRCDPLELCDLILEGAGEEAEAADLPPFRGGWAGYVGYDYGAARHGISTAVSPEDPPRVQLAWYGCLLAWDHVQQSAWIITRMMRPDVESVHSAAGELALGRRVDVRWVSARVDVALQRARSALAGCARGEDVETRPLRRGGSKKRRGDAITRAAAETGGRAVSGWPPSVRSNFSRDEYIESVREVRELILAGDIFQANISQRFTTRYGGDAWVLYRRLREETPAPYAAYFETPQATILSASPEMFLSVSVAANGSASVETRPIKGTRPRGENEKEDAQLARDLVTSEKDRAENLMIVDLLRNDLSMVCLPGSVCVDSLCELERWATVQHLVSSVRGELRPGVTPIALFRACFPGGSITGAPKIRAMQIIASIEDGDGGRPGNGTAARGVYCGSVGFFAADGAALLNIAIRTITIRNGAASFAAGGGVVLDSIPEDEYDETLAKGAGMVAAFAVGPE